MHAKLAPEDQMTIEEFLAMTEQCPDGERWALIEGVAIKNATPTDYHQYIATNIASFLLVAGRQQGATWRPMMGVGTRVPISPNSLPQPDVMVKEAQLTGTSVSDESLVLFEILSTSNTVSDQARRRRVYASVPNWQHYATVSQKKIEVVRYDRSTNWKVTTLRDLTHSLDLSALVVQMPVCEIYRGTPLATAYR